MLDLEQARRCFEQGLQALHRGAYAEAAQSFRTSLQHCPGRISTTINLATALLHQDALEEAMALLRSLLSSASNNPDLHLLLGLAQTKANQPSEAARSFETALGLAPDNVLALNNLAILHKDAGQYARAMQLFERAITLKPDYVDAHVGLGQVCKELTLYPRAIQCLQQALRLQPDHAEASMSLGNVYYAAGQSERAFEHYLQAYQLRPDLPYLLGSLLHTKAKLCLWHDEPDFDVLKSRAKAGARDLIPPFAALSMTDDAELLSAITHGFGAGRYPMRDDLGPCLPRTSTGVVNVAYYSSDFRTHAVAQLICRVLELHDRQRIRVFAFSIGTDAPDPMTRRIEHAVDVFVDVRDKSDIEVARLSRGMQIDIAVDLNGFTEKSRTGIFAYRCAPVQINYLGYPYTTGLPYFDYILADKTVVTEQARRYYSEQVAWLPDCYQANDPEKLIAPEVFRREDFGLPANGFIYCCFNNSHKIAVETFRIWMRILQAVPGSVLWLLKESGQAVPNLRQAAESLGVAGDRIIFADRMALDRHLARHALADLFLDTLPYNAHTTASDALWAGLPVLTCIGSLFPGRVAASLLKAMSLDILITANPTEYEAAAIHWARNPMLLQSLRQSLATRRRSSALFDARRFTHHLEVAYACMQDRVKSGLPPAGFTVLSEGGVSVLPSDG